MTQTPPGIAYRLRLEREYPDFRQRLAGEHTIAGWTHNPWQDAHTPDAKATAIALKYIKLFQDQFAALGYLPYTGVEVNVPLIADGGVKIPEQMVQHLHAQYEKFTTLVKEKYPPGRPTPRIDDRLTVDSEFLGRIYNDVGEVEIATPAQSPLATVARVNAVKRIMYEGSHHYGTLYSRSQEGQARPDEAIPASGCADLVASGMPPYDVYYANNEGATGEHLSFSLVRHALEPGMGYHNAKLDHEVFAAANLFTNPGWKQLFHEAFLRYLPSEALLAYGHPYVFSISKPERGKVCTHTIRYKQAEVTSSEDGTYDEQYWEGNAPEDTRLEIRSYNDASSNVALSMLGVIGIAYGVIRAIHDDPEMAARYGHGTPSLTEQDCQHILATLQETMPFNIQVPRSLHESQARFRQQSLSIAMMHQLADSTAQTPEESAAMHKEINGFQRLIVDRTKALQQAQR